MIPTAPFRLSVVIPTLDEEVAIAATLEAVTALGPGVEVLVVDGGSGDRTRQIARAHGVEVLDAPRGRGSQLAAGAAAARGDVILFLHADTHPPVDAVGRIAEALEDPRAVAGCFRLRFDGATGQARFLTWLYPRLWWLGLCYGDSGIFVRRDAYEEIGGIRPYPIFEDLDLVRRIGRRGRFVRLPVVATTSSRRFEGRSFTWTFVRWSAMQVLFWAGVSPYRLAGRYAPIREADHPGP